ncbi:lamin tail domain-containing protein [Gracilimonas sp.]|uniref:lamin tail domain-containing protein n=1 Tax=Gracilimonas sp. TaxID=1974203 RepID=UPI002870FA1C|nr:lamin tail domain-containing protein [Gracilimonas sp.]
MRTIILLLLSLTYSYSLTFAQSVNFEDSFSDQDISDWSGNPGNFTFLDENNNILLQQDANGAGTSYLSIPSTNVEGYWEFFVRMDFSPSNSNKVEIYLMSDSEDLDANLNGYKLVGGENGSDDVFRLFRVDGGTEGTEVLTGTTNISSGGDFRIKVTRSASGNWTLEVGEGYSGVLSEDATGTDNTYSSASHFGFKTIYTSTRSDLFAFDFKIDIPPLQISTITAVSDSEIDIAFNRAIDFSTAQTSNFILTPGNTNPQSVTEQSASVARLNFNTEFTGGTYAVAVSDIEDLANESTIADTSATFVVFDEYQPGDIIINEFMKDPPSGAEEYVELKNISDRYLNLNDWTIGDDNALTTISNSDVAILPDSFAVISSDAEALKNFFGEANYINASLPALNNGSDQVRLYDPNGNTADSLSYDSDWGGVDIAIERKSENVSATFRENWGDSPSANFGTPGLSNQVQPDNSPPEILDLITSDSQTLTLTASERLDIASAETISNYNISQNPEPGANTPPIPSITSAILLNGDTIELSLDIPLEEYQGDWTLSVQNLTDIFGNSTNESIDFNYFIIFTAEPGQVAINEFMYDPAPGFSEFVELYNHTDSSFNLQDWTLNDNTGTQRFITNSNIVLPRENFVILAPDSSLADLFPDASLIVMGSRFPALNNGTDAIVIKNKNGVEIDSLTYSSSWGGEEISLERREPTISAIFSENWGNSPSENLATAGLPNEIPIDDTPPEIKNLTIVNDSTLQVVFSERIQAGPAANPNNYSFSIPLNFDKPLPDLESINFLSPDTVVLNYENRIPREDDGTYFGLNIENQVDIFGNLSELLEQQFFLIDLSEPSRGDVVINEFMYDPEGTLTEFVELYNHTDRNFDLSGWFFNDNTGNRRVISDADLKLPANSYVILAPDSSLVQQFPNRSIILMGSRFSSLNNSTDAIVIRDTNGMLMDSLTYSSDWGGNGVSLERLSPTAPSIYRENWANSPSENLATPGIENQVPTDNNPPEITNITATSADSIRITFNERVDSTLAHNLNSYSLSPSVNIQKVAQYSGNMLYLVLANQLSDGVTYTINVNDQQDIFGNEMESDETTFEYIVLSEAQQRDVVINEILYRPASANSEEFIELFNRTGQNFDLSGWTLSDATGSANIPDGTQITSGEYLVLTDSQSGSMNADIVAKRNQLSTTVYVPGFPSLNNDEDAIVIKNENGLVIDSLFYNETWGGNEPGKSLERKDPESASNDASNWATSTSEAGNSAGQQSSIYQPDETAPEVIFAKLQSDGKIFVAFSEFINIYNTNVFVNDESTAITGYNERNANILILGEDAFPSGEPLVVSFSQVSDFRGNTSENLSVEVSQPLAPGNVVINEILYNPLANPDDNLPDQNEYIELYNRSEYAISLEGFFLHDEPDENNEVRDIQPVSSQFKWIAPNDYVVVYAEDEATTFGESRLARYFEMTEVDESSYVRIDRSSLSLANNDDAIFLADSTGTTIDSVFYDESWQNPNLFDTDGIALERIDPNGPSNDPSNWSSSTRVNGGTPGEQNSIFQQAGTAPDNSGITFTPNPFSPDDDGSEDNLFINYKLDEPDYLLRIRIFDRYGREVRKLADGYQAGFEGSLIWDGLTDDGNKNRVGIYIVLFEAYNSANGQNRTFKETVVLARKF